MASVTHRLAFERPILELEAKIVKLEMAGGSDYARLEEIRQHKRELADLKRQVYSSLTPWETVQVARHPDRPMTSDYLNLVFDEFVELHGDKFFGDDRAMHAVLPSSIATKSWSSVIKKERPSRNGLPAIPAVPTRKAIARPWPR